MHDAEEYVVERIMWERRGRHAEIAGTIHLILKRLDDLVAKVGAAQSTADGKIGAEALDPMNGAIRRPADDAAAARLATFGAVLMDAQLLAACPAAFGMSALGGTADPLPLDAVGVVSGPFGHA